VKRTTAATLLLSAMAAVSGAQAPAEAPGPGRPRDEAGRLIDAYVISNLQESLALSDDQFVKALPLVKRLHTDRREIMQRRGRALGEMRRLLKSGAATESPVLEQLKEVKALEADEPARIRKTMDAIDGILTPLQQAKFRILEVEVGQKLREMMNQMRRQGRQGMRPGAGRPADRPEE